MEEKENSADAGGGLIVVAIALSGGSKSKALVKWAMDKFVPEGKVSFKLLHVFPKITAVPNPNLVVDYYSVGNLVPLQQVREDVATAYKKEVELQKMEMILPYQKLCKLRKIPADIILLEADDIPNALSQEITKIGAKFIVIGTSSNGLFSRKGKGQWLSSLISKRAPGFCTVYVVSKGKLQSLRPSDKENANVHMLDDTTSVSGDSADTSLRYSSSTLYDTTTMSGSMISRASSTTTYTTGSGSFASENQSTSSLPSTLSSSQTSTKIDMELERLRMELRHARGMYTTPQNETMDASRKDRDVTTNGLVGPPSHFICHILKDVMDDPCIAADGYTYDRKAIEMWLRENDTSPTTDLMLSNMDLMPDYTLHCAIMEWKTRRESPRNSR